MFPDFVGEESDRWEVYTLKSEAHNFQALQDFTRRVVGLFREASLMQCGPDESSMPCRRRAREVGVGGVSRALATGIIIAVLVALVLLGGIKRIGEVAGKLVPIMAIFGR